MHYRPSGAPVNGTSPKLVHFPRISSDTSPLKHENTIDTSRKYHRSVFDIFSFLRSKRQEKPILIRDPDLPERKAPPKPIIQRHSILKMESSVEALPYMWPHDGSLDPKTTALVIIDMQKDCKFDFTFLSGRFCSLLQPLPPLDSPHFHIIPLRLPFSSISAHVICFSSSLLSLTRLFLINHNM